MPVVFATQDSSILIRSQSAASLVMIRTWMGDRFFGRRKKINSIVVFFKTLQIKFAIDNDLYTTRWKFIHVN